MELLGFTESFKFKLMNNMSQVPRCRCTLAEVMKKEKAEAQTLAHQLCFQAPRRLLLQLDLTLTISFSLPMSLSFSLAVNIQYQDLHEYDFITCEQSKSNINPSLSLRRLLI